MLKTDISKCENREELLSEDAWPLTHWMYFRTMAVDIGHLHTDKDCEKFHERNQQVALIFGEESCKQVTLEHIKRYKGLRTNVVNTGGQAWNGRLLDMIKSQAKRQSGR